MFLRTTQPIPIPMDLKRGTTSHSFKNELAIKIKDTSNYGLHKNLGSMTYGVHLGETYTDWDEGSFKVTDNPTDLAIGGKGFLPLHLLTNPVRQV